MFKGFVLTVEAEDDREKGAAGRFTLYSDSKSKFDERCANTVTHANFLPTGEVQIDWVAPKEGAGCVIFRAAVMDSTNTWYADELMDASLTQRVCEDQQENMDEQRPIEPVCCACEEAKYEVTFEGLWSRHTHPKDFPADSWVTRFSDVIGASHDVEYRFWTYNGMATDGLKQVAERGTTRALEAELKAESDHIRTIIKARGISYPNVTGKTFAVFRVDRRNHLMSLVSMIDPSPDWIVGVSGLELCLANCSWVDHVQLNLYPFDAGTDSGLTYIAPDQPTNPQEPIRKLSSSFPNTEQSPFFDPSGEPMRPMARLSLVRQRLYEKTCDGQPSDLEDPEQPSDANREGCEVRDWAPWAECSVTCGKGTRHRQRFYVNAELANERGCKRMLTSRQQCFNGPKLCPGLSSQRNVADDPECELTPWTAWSTCSAPCGKGTRTRSRKFKHRAGKRCYMAPDAPILQQNEDCFGQDDCSGGSNSGGQPVEPPNGCYLAEWSQWSSCSVSCGRGQQVRHRVPLAVDKTLGDEPSLGESPRTGPCAGVAMREQVYCTAPSCRLTPEQTRVVCRLPADPGPCRGHLQRWFFHTDSRVCHAFEYGGCRGNRNNFATMAECERVCTNKDALVADRQEAMQKYGVRLSGAITYSEPTGKEFKPFQPPRQHHHHHGHHHHHHGDKEHATTTAAAGTQYAPDLEPGSYLRAVEDWRNSRPTAEDWRFSRPTMSPLSVTTVVPGDVVDCKLSPWGPWSPCDATCGTGYRTRTRQILVNPQNGGKACDKKLLARKRCTRLPPCSGSLVRDMFDDEADEDGYQRPSENDCVMSEWSAWSQCTSSCGVNAQKIRSRTVEKDPGPGGRPCGLRLEVRNCDFLPCFQPR
ncbi:spondin-1-like [Thrips palmi]|uniref:Spondin-1 n=1 Tax=Thrips palmi TaxID=161013 RepID=A0A6P8ZMF8_THRPL|nr:spondin-1-like [Thrips palmi]